MSLQPLLHEPTYKYYSSVSVNTALRRRAVGLVVVVVRVERVAGLRVVVALAAGVAFVVVRVVRVVFVLALLAGVALVLVFVDRPDAAVVWAGWAVLSASGL